MEKEFNPDREFKAERTIEVLEQALEALENPHPLGQVQAVAEAITFHLAKIRVSLAFDHKKTQERFIRHIKATTLYNWSQINDLKAQLKDRKFLDVVSYIENTRKQDLRINTDTLIVLILATPTPFQVKT